MVMPPLTKFDVALTGKIRYRISWNKKIIVQVQHTYKLMGLFEINQKEYYEWRDATFNDFQELKQI